MIRLELNDVQELMQLYQGAMEGKFSAGDELLASPKLGTAMDKLVDRLIAEARSAHNEPMVEMMIEHRQLKVEYPQFLRLQGYLKALEEAQGDLARADKVRLLEVAAKPLLLDDNIVFLLLGE